MNINPSRGVASAIAAACLLMPLPDASARPPAPLAPDCTTFQQLSSTFNVKQDNGISVTIALSGNNFGPSATYTAPGKGDVNGNATGSFTGTLVSVNVHWDNGFSNQYTGGINPDGTAQGFTLNNQNTKNNWTSIGRQFSCAPSPAAAAAPAPAPDPIPAAAPAPTPPPKDAVVVDIQQSPTSVSVNVKNTSTLAGKCTYDAHPTVGFLLPSVHRDFRLNPNDATTLDFLAPPLGSTYHVVVSCHGNFNGQDDEFGHFEQDVTGGL